MILPFPEETDILVSLSHRVQNRDGCRRPFNSLSSCLNSPTNMESTCGITPLQHRSSRDAGPHPFSIMPSTLYTSGPGKPGRATDSDIMPKGRVHSCRQPWCFHGHAPMRYMTLITKGSPWTTSTLMQSSDGLEAERVTSLCLCLYHPHKNKADRGWMIDHLLLLGRNPN